MPDDQDDGYTFDERPAASIERAHEDRALRPLLIIFVVHVVLAGALVLLAALREGSLLARAALAILAMFSVDAIRRARRRRRTAIWIGALWALSALTAGAASYLGLL